AGADPGLLVRSPPRADAGPLSGPVGAPAAERGVARGDVRITRAVPLLAVPGPADVGAGGRRPGRPAQPLAGPAGGRGPARGPGGARTPRAFLRRAGHRDAAPAHPALSGEGDGPGRPRLDAAGGYRLRHMGAGD